MRLAEIDRIVQTFLKDRNALDGVSVAELRRRLKDGGVVLDVRPGGEYRAGHIAGARSVPLAELEARLREIPKDQEVVAYCRGPYCVFADEAVALLRHPRLPRHGGSSWDSPTGRLEDFRWKECREGQHDDHRCRHAAEMAGRRETCDRARCPEGG